MTSRFWNTPKATTPSRTATHIIPLYTADWSNEWESSKKWDFDFFADKFGNEDVTLINNAGLVKDSEQAYDIVKLRDYIANMRKGAKEYLKFSRMVEEQSVLRDDFDYAWLRKVPHPVCPKRFVLLFYGRQKHHHAHSRRICHYRVCAGKRYQTLGVLPL